MRKRTTIYMVVAAVLLAGIGMFFRYLFYSSDSGGTDTQKLSAEGLHAVPSDAIFLLETGSLHDIADMTDGGSALGKILECLPSDFQDWEAIVSMHYSSKNQVAPLLLVEIPERHATEEFMTRLLSNFRSVVEKRYGNVPVYRSAIPEASLALYGKILLMSPSQVLVEASLRTLEDVSSDREENFTEAMASVSWDQGVLHIMSANLGKLFSGAAARNCVKYASDFQDFADWATLSMESREGLRVFEGLMGNNRRGSRLSEVFMGQKEQRPSIYEAVPFYSAYVVSIPSASRAKYLESYSAYLDTKRKGSRTAKGQTAFIESLKVQEAAVFSCDLDGQQKILAMKAGNSKGLRPWRDTVLECSEVMNVPDLLGNVFRPSSDSHCCALGDWLFIGGESALTALLKERRQGTFFSLQNWLSQTPAGGELRKAYTLALYINTSIYGDTLATFLKNPYSKMLKSATGEKNFEIVTAGLYNAGSEAGCRVALYSQDITPVLPPSQDNGDVPVPGFTLDIPQGPFPVVNFVDGSQNYLEQRPNMDLRLLNSAKKAVWTVKFSTPLCGMVQQIDFLKNDKLQMLFASKDRIYLLDRLGRMVARFPVTLDREVLLGPAVYDFNGTRDYNIMVLHTDNSLALYNLSGEKADGWNDITLNEPIAGLPRLLELGSGKYWIVRTPYQTLIYDIHGTICADFSKRYRLAHDSQVSPVSDKDVRVTTAEGREYILDLTDGEFRRR